METKSTDSGSNFFSIIARIVTELAFDGFISEMVQAFFGLNLSATDIVGSFLAGVGG